MGRAKKKREIEVVEETDDDEGVSRDFVMARVAAARNALQAAIESLDECTAAFVNPDEDEDGQERKDLLDGAIEQVGVASRALEAAEEVIEDVDFELGEPWDVDGDD